MKSYLAETQPQKLGSLGACLLHSSQSVGAQRRAGREAKSDLAFHIMLLRCAEQT